jgi:hypothetical protein
VFKEEEEIVKTKPDVEGKPQYVIPEKIKSAPQIDDFAVAMNQLSDDQIRLVNKLPPIEVYAIESDNGYYRAADRKLVAQPLKRGGSIVRHEYGHHVDFELGRKANNFGSISASDEGFINAYELDRKQLGLSKTATFGDSIKFLQAEIYDVEQVQTSFGLRNKRTLKDDELGNYSDIVDALSHGKMQKIYGGFGHGVTYFKRKGTRQQESFANLFALRNTKYWSLVQKNMPNMAKRFDEIVEEYLK